MKEFLKSLKLNEEKISFFLGVLAVLLVGTLLVNYFKSINRNQTGQITTTSVSTATETGMGEIKSLEESGTVTLPADYEIKPGDSLWKISEKVYGSGYQWKTIYEANKQTIRNPSLISVGTKITIPDLESEDLTKYQVKGGDTLWDISVKMCGDGYAWPVIASENKLENPRLITPGIVLRIRCR